MDAVRRPDLDLVLYGATGFTGRLAAQYLAERAPEDLRWAIAGRDRERLEALRQRLGSARDRVEVAVADARDADAVSRLVARTQVVATTAGPFARHGDPLVEACVAHGVDYADITGETPWIRSLIERFHEAAASRGTRIVPCCGFDSVPSDLGAWMVADWIRREWGRPVREVRAAFRAGGGGLNGGTLASVLAMAEEGLLDALDDVLLLNPPGHRSEEERRRSADRTGVSWDADLRCWLAPFVMERINSRVVRRSNGLLAEWGEGYGEEFTYREAAETRSRAGGWALAAGERAAWRLLRQRLARRAIARLGPRPGQGPSEAAQERGWFRCRLIGVADDGRRVAGELSGRGDPGNRATVTFLAESALALALERDRLPGGAERGGILTPATALGGVLLERLRAAGLRLTVEPLDAPMPAGAATPGR